MALSTPTTLTINDLIIAQLEAKLNQTIPLMPKAFNRVLAKTLSGLFILHYKYAGNSQLQQFVQTASIEETTINGVVISPLKFLGRLFGVDDPIDAIQAEFIIDITVTNQTGSLPSGTQLVNSDNGVTYITIGVVLLDAATVQATIRAASDQAGGDGSGAIGNLNVSDIVSFANPLPNVSRNAVIDSQTVTGVDAEATELYRQRIIDLVQKRPQGGAYSDYELWGEEVAGIVNVYPYTSDNPGQVDYYVEATIASSGDPDGIPTTLQLQAVFDNIEKDQNGLASRRPANALHNSLPITRKGFDVEVSGIIVDNLADVQAQIDTTVIDYFLNAEPFIDGLTIPPRLDKITRSALIGVVNDIVSAANGTFTTLTFAETLIPAVDLELYVLQQGEKAKLSTSVVYGTLLAECDFESGSGDYRSYHANGSLWWEGRNGVHPNWIIPNKGDPISGQLVWNDTVVTVEKAVAA